MAETTLQPTFIAAAGMATLSNTKNRFMTTPDTYDNPIIIEPNSKAEKSVIWLHGLGADGHDFLPVVELLGCSSYRFILPHAPVQPVTLNNGYEMRAWYDIYGLSTDSQQDANGIQASQRYIEQLIQDELNKGMQSTQIVLAGFSQGGAIALQTGLRHRKPLAGIIALSTYLPLKSSLDTEQSAENANTPIFMAHGTYDEVITLETNIASRDVLCKHQYNVQWHEYPMAHTVSLDVIGDIRQFLTTLNI